MPGKPHDFKYLWVEWLLSLCPENLMPEITSHICMVCSWFDQNTSFLPFCLCPVLTWRMVQGQCVTREPSYCLSWEWKGCWYLYKYTMLSPTPSFQPWFTPYQSPRSNLVWAGSMASLGVQPKEPGNWFCIRSRSKVIMLWYPNSSEGCKIWCKLFLNFQCSEKKTPCLLSL